MEKNNVCKIIRDSHFLSCILSGAELRHLYQLPSNMSLIDAHRLKAIHIQHDVLSSIYFQNRLRL